MNIHWYVYCYTHVHIDYIHKFSLSLYVSLTPPIPKSNKLMDQWVQMEPEAIVYKQKLKKERKKKKLQLIKKK